MTEERLKEIEAGINPKHGFVMIPMDLWTECVDEIRRCWAVAADVNRGLIDMVNKERADLRERLDNWRKL